MRQIDSDSLPHVVNCLVSIANSSVHTFWARLAARWWGVHLAPGCSFFGRARFFRYPRSQISIGTGCTFRSSSASNLIGVNRPCIISTLMEGSKIEIGPQCGFSGTVIGCASRITLRENVRCGANTLITDTDWHTNDLRTGPDAPVVIEKDVWLGANVSVLKGVTVGYMTVVGAGSVVTHSLPAGVFAAGIPAKVIKKIDDHVLVELDKQLCAVAAIQ